jgi:hypothetical protein
MMRKNEGGLIYKWFHDIGPEAINSVAELLIFDDGTTNAYFYCPLLYFFSLKISTLLMGTIFFTEFPRLFYNFPNLNPMLNRNSFLRLTLFQNKNDQ